MTRLEQLYSMKMKELVAIAEELGIKVNKKGKNSVAAEKIYAEEQRLGLETIKEGDDVARILELTGAEPMIDCSTEPESSPEEHVEEVTVEEAVADSAAEIKKERKPRQKKESPEREQFLARAKAYIDAAGFGIKEWEKIPNLFAVKNGKKTVAEVRLTLKGWTLNVSKDIAEVMSTSYTEQKYFLPATIRLPYSAWDMFEDFVNAI